MHEGKPFVFVETFMGNCGATATHDGQEGMGALGANQSNIPFEIIELAEPIRIEQYGLVPDTGGPASAAGCRWRATTGCWPTRCRARRCCL
jgi:N-methylhydantoinase B